MAGNGSILKENLLQRVANYVNNQSERGNEAANQFLIEVFRDFIVDPSAVSEISRVTITENEVKSINVPHGVTKICKRGFSSLKNLERVNLPNTVSEMEDEAFCDCPNLTAVNIPESVNCRQNGLGCFQEL